MSNGNTPLHLAIHNFIDDISRIRTRLEQDDSDINARNAQGETPLLSAVRQRGRHCPELIIMLLRHGADPKAATPDGNTALHWLSMGCANCCYMEFDLASRKVIEILLKYGGCDVNAVNSKGETPLHLLVRKQNLRDIVLIKMYLAYGADLSIKDAIGQTAYDAFCHLTRLNTRRRWPTVQMLLVQANERQEYRITELHVACVYHEVEEVHNLLKLGADVNATDTFGKSPLYYAVMAPGAANRGLTSKLLLDYGADINEAPFMDPYLCIQLATSAILDTRDIHFKNLLDNFFKHQARLVKLREEQIERGIISIDKMSYLPDLYTSLIFSSGSTQDKAEHAKWYNNWLSVCTDELKLMSETKIGDSTVFFFDLLIASARQSETYAKNKELVKAFDVQKTMFPMYEGMLDAKLAKDLERRKLIESAAVSLSNTLRFADPSDEFYERTFSFCSNRDLISLIDGLEEE